MKAFEVINRASGHSFGIVVASDEAEAIQTTLDQAGEQGPADPELTADQVYDKHRLSLTEDQGRHWLDVCKDGEWTMFGIMRNGILVDCDGVGLDVPSDHLPPVLLRAMLASAE